MKNLFMEVESGEINGKDGKKFGKGWKNSVIHLADI